MGVVAVTTNDETWDELVIFVFLEVLEYYHTQNYLR